MPQAVTGKKIDTLLVIRGLLAIAVVVFHSATMHENTTAFINIPGRTAVWMFFGISGYVISYGFFTERYVFTKKDLGVFYLNRFLRIYPLFLLLSLLAWITGLLTSGQSSFHLKDVLPQLLMFQFNHDYMFSRVFWTLGIEVQFYIIAPLLAAFIMGRFPYKWFLLAGVYFLFVCWVPFAFYLFGQSFDGRNLPANLSHFFIGMLACKLMLEKKLPAINKALLIIIILALLAVTNYLYAHHIDYYWTAGSVTIDFIILLCVLLHKEVSGTTYGSKNYLLRAFSFLGVISYGVYAWHPYFIQYTPQIERKTLILILVSVSAAFLSYQFVEKPVLSLKGKRRKAGFGN